MSNAVILGTGSCLPKRVVTNADLEQMVETSDEWITSRTGIRSRHLAGADELNYQLATKAGRRALAVTGIDAQELDLIIVATLSPHMIMPSTACFVQAELGAENAFAYDINAACAGFTYGLDLASNYIQNRPEMKILLIGAETLSARVNWQDRNTCVLFGDGAGAVVLGEVPEGYGILGVHLGSDGGGGPLLSLPAGGTRIPASEESVKNRLHYIHMEGNEVFKFAVKIMGEAAFRALEQAGMQATDVDWLIPHQANIRIIQSAAKRLKMPMEKVVVNVDRHGNTSSASIPIALEEAIHDGRIKSGQTVVMVGFGAGLTWASTVIRWHHK